MSASCESESQSVRWVYNAQQSILLTLAKSRLPFSLLLTLIFNDNTAFSFRCRSLCVSPFVGDVWMSHLGRTPEQKYCLRSLKQKVKSTNHCLILIRFSQRAQPTVMTQAVTGSVMMSGSSTECSVASTELIFM
ncbi:uncharacterized [Tachysurus ichikawai]